MPMKKTIFPISPALRVEKDEAEMQYQKYLETQITEEEIYECDHCEAPWLCPGICFKNFLRFRFKRESVREHLMLVQVSERIYRPFNKKTGRFHNLELGIDEVM